MLYSAHKFNSNQQFMTVQEFQQTRGNLGGLTHDKNLNNDDMIHVNNIFIAP